tara:strand:- start:62 stop:280 length:219 start_codon:yes stop_codon:yes gene_type:complete
MKVTNVVTPSFFQTNSGKVYAAVVDGRATEINHRNREPMVLLTKADFNEMQMTIRAYKMDIDDLAAKLEGDK